MGRSHIYVLRAGFALLILATAAYLAAIWTTEITSERFGLTGVVFVVSGLVALGLGRLMSPVPASMR
jgi:high-affinity Fe2+/Pb2+ permease